MNIGYGGIGDHKSNIVQDASHKFEGYRAKYPNIVQDASHEFEGDRAKYPKSNIVQDASHNF